MIDTRYDYFAVEDLIGDGDECFALMVICSHHTPIAIVEQLAELIPTLLDDLAYDTDTRPEVLAMLARHENEHVRHAVAGNPSTPSSALDLLCADASTAVRFNLSGNASTSTSALDFLSEDPNPFVAGEALMNRESRS